MVIKEPGRRTGSGAFTEAKLFASDGNEIVGKRCSSRSGNSWEDIFDLPDNEVFLMLVTDISNSGKNYSTFKIVGTVGREEEKSLSEIQIKLLNEFKKKIEKNGGRKYEQDNFF